METTQIRGIISVDVKSTITQETINHVAQRLMSALDERFAIRGRITRIAPEGIEINIGSTVGLRTDQVLTVLSDEDPPADLCRLKVLRCGQSSAWTALVGEGQQPKKGLRVQATP